MKVGANIASRAAKSTVAPVVGPLEAAWKGFKGDGEAARYALARTEVAAGLGLFWWSQWAAGNLTGTGPDDPQANAQWRAQGNTPNSLKVAGQPVSLALLGAPGAHAIILANAFENAMRTPPLKVARKAILTGGQARDIPVLQMTPETEKFLMQWVAGAAEGLQEISYLRSIADFLKKGPTDPGFVARTGSSFVGGDILNRIGAAFDPKQRETAREGWVAQFTDTLKSRTPGLRETLPTKQDALGRDLPNPAYGRLTPAQGNGQEPSTTVQAALDSGVRLSTPPDSISVDGISVPLKREEQRAYQRYAGEVVDKYVQRAIAKPEWASYSAKKRQAVIQDIQKEAHAAASQKVQRDIGSSELKRRIQGVRALDPVPVR
jgi:hypothetical protein